MVRTALVTVAAIVGKQVCAWGVADKTLDRLSIGIGMIPRGEVGLIFASELKRLHAAGKIPLDDSVYPSIVFMVIATTIVTPPLLKWSMNRKKTPPPSAVA